MPSGCRGEATVADVCCGVVLLIPALILGLILVLLLLLLVCFFLSDMSSPARTGKACGGGGGGTPAGEREIHVLAVDDSSVDRAVIARLLRNSKCRVTAVDSGKKALELLGLEPNVSMIITDYWMPEMTGYELLKRVKESSKLREIPVVIMSSENVPNRINRCLEEGAEDFLLKPVRPADVSRLSNWIR